MRINRGKQYIILIVMHMVLSVCGNSSSESSGSAKGEDNKEMVMEQISWAENIATTNMWKVILEEKGYDVEFQLVDMGTIMAALEKGDLDITLEVWLPVQDAFYLEQYKDTVVFEIGRAHV